MLDLRCAHEALSPAAEIRHEALCLQPIQTNCPLRDLILRNQCNTRLFALSNQRLFEQRLLEQTRSQRQILGPALLAEATQSFHAMQIHTDGEALLYQHSDIATHLQLPEYYSHQNQDHLSNMQNTSPSADEIHSRETQAPATTGAEFYEYAFLSRTAL